MDDDIEAELERELALLDGASFASTSEGPTALHGLAGLTNTDSDTEDGGGDEDEPASLRAFREALQRRDASLDGFQHELENAQQQISQSMLAGSAAGEEQPLGSMLASGDPNVDVHACVPHGEGMQHAEDASTDGTGADGEETVNLQSLLKGQNIKSIIQDLQQQLQAASRPSTAAVQADEPSASPVGTSFRAPSPPLRQSVQSVSSLLPPEHNSYEALVAERQAALEEYRAQEAARHAAAEQARQYREEQAQRQREEAEARARQQQDDFARQQQAALAAREAAQRELQEQRKAAEAEAAAELARLAEERERLKAHMAAQAEEAAERENEIRRLQMEMDCRVAENAWHNLAARRIARAWAGYRASEARHQRLHNITLVQALWRGRIARKLSHQLQEQRGVLQRLEEAVRRGLLEAVQETANQASSLGMQDEVAGRVAEFEARVRQAAERLAAAAANGSALTFNPALEAARQFAHLDGAVAAAQVEFSRRKAAAEAALQAAIADQPMQNVKRALEEAAQLGMDTSALTIALEAARKRDADIAASLQQAASVKHFDVAAFEQLSARAALVGLKGDVAAAKVVLDKRRRLLARELAQSAETADAATLRGLMSEAQAMGMTREADVLAAKLSQQKDGVVAQLNSALAIGNTQAFELLLERGESVGLEPQVVEELRARMARRQADSAAQLQQQAQSGSLAAFKQARRNAVVCSAMEGLEASERMFEERRAGCAGALSAAVAGLRAHLSGQPGAAVQLAAALRQCCMLVTEPQGSQESTSRAMRIRRHPVRCAQAAEQLQLQLPQSVVLLVPQPAVRGCTQDVWQASVTALRLGMEANVRLALGSLEVHGLDGSSEAAKALGSKNAQMDYWGSLTLPTWQQAQDAEAVHMAAGIDVSQAAWAQMGERATAPEGQAWLWPVHTPHYLLHEQGDRLLCAPSRSSQSGSTDPAAQQHLQHHRARAGQVPVGPRHSTTGSAGGRLLTPALLGHIAVQDAAQQQQLVRLDLGLEQLTGLGDLGSWCPNLQVLLATANQLSSLDSVSRLTSLQDLGLRDNLLPSLRGLGRKPALRKLNVDCNELVQLDGLEGVPVLHTLSVNDNHLGSLSLHHPGSGGPPASALVACAGTLNTLLAASNKLVSLHGLAVCRVLTHLDVSRNQLTNLQGLGACSSLQRLIAPHNRLTIWPAAELACLGQLRLCDLTGNAIQRLEGPMGAATPLLLPPALEVLLLQDNQIQAVAELHGAQRLCVLDLSFNSLEALDTLHALAPLGALTSLQVHDNPVAEAPEYETAVRAACPGLRELDNNPIADAAIVVNMARTVACSPAVVCATRARLTGMQYQDLSAVVAATAACMPPAPTGDTLSQMHSPTAAAAALTYLAFNATTSPVLSSNQAPTAGPWLQHVDSAWQAGRVASTVTTHASQLAATACLRPAASAAGPEAAGLPRAGAARVLLEDLDAPGCSGLRKLSVQWKGVSFARAAAAKSGMPALTGMQDQALAALSYEQQYEQSMAALCQQHGAELAAAAARAPQTACEQLVVRESFFEQRAQELGRAAAKIQAAWRGRNARVAVKVMRSEQYQQVRRVAAVRIQRVWRGHHVRSSPQLAAARRQHAAEREAQRLLEDEARRAGEAAEARAREAAAVRIQAAVRGFGVRRRLKAALHAAKYQDDDGSDYEGVEDDFLADVEKMLQQEQIPTAPPRAPVPKQTASQLVSMVQAAVVGGAFTGIQSHTTAPLPAAAFAYAINPAMMQALPALSRAFAAKKGVPGARAAAPAHGTEPSAPVPPVTPLPIGPPPMPTPTEEHADRKQVVLSSSPTKQAWGLPSSGLAPASLSPATVGQLPPLKVLPGQQRPAPVSVLHSEYSYTGDGSTVAPDSPDSPGASYVEGSVTSPNSDAAPFAEKRQRHVERMEKLMAEWGFKDMATAELYWRRQQRQTQGQTRRKLEAKYKDPRLRLHKLQQVVDQRAPLRPEDVMRQRPHGPEVQLHRGALQGPPSRQMAEGGSPPAPHASHGARNGRQVASADSADTPAGSTGAGGVQYQRSSSFHGTGVGHGVGQAGSLLPYDLTAAAARSPGGAGVLQLPAVSRRSTSLSDIAGPARGSPAGGHVAHSHHRDEDGESVSGHSMAASAASEPANGRAGNAAAILRKSLSSTHRGAASVVATAAGKVQQPLVLPQLGHMSNNWVLSSPNGTPPGLGRGVGIGGARLGGVLEVTPALPRNQAGGTGSTTTKSSQLPPRAR